MASEYSGNLIPVMTADNAPSPFITSASSVYDSNYPAWKAFNRVISGNYQSWVSARGVTTGWLKVDLGTQIKIEKYSLTLGDQSSAWVTAMPKRWTFEGSNTGSFSGEQVVLDTRTNETGWSMNEKREYTFQNNSKYRYYRINITENNGNSSYVVITEMEFMEMIAKNKVLIKSSFGEVLKVANNELFSINQASERNFIKYGMDDLTALDTKVDIEKKTYINNKSIALGSGKTFEQAIDLTKYRVKIISFK